MREQLRKCTQDIFKQRIYWYANELDAKADEIWAHVQKKQAENE